MPSKYAVITEMGIWSASTRFRAVQHLPRLTERLGPIDLLLADDRPVRRPGRLGQGVFFADHGVRYVKRFAQLQRRVDQYDAVFVQRGAYPLGPSAVANPLKRFEGRVVFDLDDDIFHVRPALAAKGPAAHWIYGPQQGAALLRRADAVTVSTELLAASLPAHASPVTVLPTVPDPTGYRLAEHTTANTTIGWAGTNGGLGYLDPLREVFANLESDGVGRLQVVSSAPWSGPSTFVPWALENEPTLFADFAVGIMPLPDTAYTRGKAGFKLLQYMAAGVPVVASPVGSNQSLIERSDAGLLATTSEEWHDALRRLLTDVPLRQRLGASGRAFIEEYADLEGQAETLTKLLRAP